MDNELSDSLKTLKTNTAVNFDFILQDLLSRLRFHPAVYEIRTGEIFRIDAINVDEESFHVWHGKEYDWYSIRRFRPILYPVNNVYNSGRSGRSVFNLVCSIMKGCDMEFNESNLEFESRVKSKMPLSFAIDVLEVLNYRFIDYRNLIKYGMAIDANKLNKNPYINKDGRSS